MLDEIVDKIWATFDQNLAKGLNFIELKMLFHDICHNHAKFLNMKKDHYKKHHDHN